MSELLSAGLSVTLIGMGVVFVLLTMLVGIVHAMSAFTRLFPDHVEASSSTPEIDAEIISAIGAAIHRYRRNHSRDA